MAEMSRDAEIKGIWARYGWFYRLLRGAVLIGVGVLVGMLIYAEPGVRADYVMNLFVTALSLGATALIFDELNRKRSEDDLKRQLVDDAASMSNEIAKNAIHQIDRKGWLKGDDGLLKGEKLSDANLQKAYIGGANLQKAHLDGANLQEADLRRADLQGADLTSANLQGTILWEAHLEKSRLSYSNLQGAFLLSADLREADLSEANLQRADLRTAHLNGTRLLDADLRGADLLLADLNGARLGWNAPQNKFESLMRAEFDETTILPDGSTWAPEIDLHRFTDPDHPDFYPVSDKVHDYLESLT